MEPIIEKLSTVSDDLHQRNVCWDKWTKEERLKLFELYLLISQKEHLILRLTHQYQGDDNYESIFRDLDMCYFDDKVEGVEDAIGMIKQYIEK